MIVVVGNPAYRAEPPAGPAGRAALVALAAAGTGARVELVGRAGDDPAGDALLLALAQHGVGHAAVLRDPARATPVAVAEPPAAEDAAVAPQVAERAIRSPAPDAGGAAPVLDAADVALGLRYLTEFAVLVVTDDGVDNDVTATAVEAAAFATAHVVVIVPPGGPEPRGLPGDALVLEAPADDVDGVFAAMVGRLVVALERGESPRQALATATAATGWEAAPGA